MSEYLSPRQEQQRPDAKPGEALPDYLTPAERANLARQMGFPEDLPKAFKTWMLDYIAVNGLDIPVSQMHGFIGFRPRVATLGDTSATGNSSYTDLGGPELTDMEKGQYLLLFGYNSSNPSNPADPGIGMASPSVNGETASDSNAAMCEGEYQSSMYYRLVTLTQANNSIKLMYRMQGGTGDRDFNRPFLIALKIGN